LGYQIAQKFGVAVTKLKPGLVPLSFHPDEWKPYAELSGISIESNISCSGKSFRDSLLFTHRGLSGPAILQISSYWEHGQPLHVDLLPELDATSLFAAQQGNHMLLSNFLAHYLPRRFAEAWCRQWIEDKPFNQYSVKELATFASRLHDWRITPSGTLGYAKAEVTCGGVDTRALSSKTMECSSVPGLYFIGEVLDVTGQLGGYNFQWAWASGHAAGETV
jgi:predicted Rossmann fold flavoprotein